MTNYELFAGGDLTGVHLAIGEGSVDATGMALSKTSLAYVDGTTTSTFDKTKVELATVTDKATATASSITVADFTGKSLVCKKDNITMLRDDANVDYKSSMTAFQFKVELKSPTVTAISSIGDAAVDLSYKAGAVSSEVHLNCVDDSTTTGLRMAQSPSPNSSGILSTVLWNGLSFADTGLSALSSFALSDLLLSVGLLGSKLFSRLTNTYLSITDEVLKKSSTLSNSSLAFGDNGKSCTLDKSQLATDTAAFSISNTGTMSLSATEIKLSNIAFDSLTTTAGAFTNQFVRIKSGTTYYKIPLRFD